MVAPYLQYYSSE